MKLTLMYVLFKSDTILLSSTSRIEYKSTLWMLMARCCNTRVYEHQQPQSCPVNDYTTSISSDEEVKPVPYKILVEYTYEEH